MRGAWIVAAWLLAGCQFETAAGGGTEGAEAGGTSSPDPDPDPPVATSAMTGATTDDSDSGTSDAESTSTSGTNPVGETGSSSGPSGSASSESSTGEPPPMLGWCDGGPELVACYGFENLGSGTLVDDSMYGNDGSIVDIEVEASGPLAEAARFSSGGSISIPATPQCDLEQDFSFEMWVLLDELPAANRYGVMDRDGMYSVFAYPDGIRVGGRGENNINVGAPPLGAWFHVAFTMGPAFTRVYIDGVAVSETPSVVPNGGVGNNNPMSVGCSSPGLDQAMAGAVGGLRVWSEERSQAQICAAAGRCSITRSSSDTRVSGRRWRPIGFR